MGKLFEGGYFSREDTNQGNTVFPSAYFCLLIHITMFCFVLFCFCLFTSFIYDCGHITTDSLFCFLCFLFLLSLHKVNNWQAGILLITPGIYLMLGHFYGHLSYLFTLWNLPQSYSVKEAIITGATLQNTLVWFLTELEILRQFTYTNYAILEKYPQL